jgi:hypothetical protein
MPEILTFLTEELTIQHSTDISHQGSECSESTPEQVQEVLVQSPTSSVMFVATTTKDVIIDAVTIKVTTMQKTVTTQTVLHPKSERATLNKKEKTRCICSSYSKAS